MLKDLVLSKSHTSGPQHCQVSSSVYRRSPKWRRHPLGRISRQYPFMAKKTSTTMSAPHANPTIAIEVLLALGSLFISYKAPLVSNLRF